MKFPVKASQTLAFLVLGQLALILCEDYSQQGLDSTQGVPSDPKAFLEQCCREGREAQESIQCHQQYQPKIMTVNLHFDRQCFGAFFGCCVITKATIYCREGHEMSRNSTKCSSVTKTEDPVTMKTELIEECCEACREGRKGAANETPCNEAPNYQQKGSVWEKSFIECCNKTKAEAPLLRQHLYQNTEPAPDETRHIDSNACSRCLYGCDYLPDGTLTCATDAAVLQQSQLIFICLSLAFSVLLVA